MQRKVLAPHLARIDALAAEINEHVPIGTTRVVDFRADLAGMFVVAVAAMYESCVKETVVSYASQQNPKFEYFAQKSFERLNSRIRISDLRNYAKRFDEAIFEQFRSNLDHKKAKFQTCLGQDLAANYDQILDWRHDFAHEGRRNTTLEEAVKTHRMARHVIFAFHDAFPD